MKQLAPPSPEGAVMHHVRVPGTYRPQDDTLLLTRAMLALELARGRRVPDLRTGTGR